MGYPGENRSLAASKTHQPQAGGGSRATKLNRAARMGPSHCIPTVPTDPETQDRTKSL